VPIPRKPWVEKVEVAVPPKNATVAESLVVEALALNCWRAVQVLAFVRLRERVPEVVMVPPERVPSVATEVMVPAPAPRHVLLTKTQPPVSVMPFANDDVAAERLFIAPPVRVRPPALANPPPATERPEEIKDEVAAVFTKIAPPVRVRPWEEAREEAETPPEKVEVAEEVLIREPTVKTVPVAVMLVPSNQRLPRE